MTQLEVFNALEDCRWKDRMNPIEFSKTLPICHNTQRIHLKHGKAKWKTVVAIIKYLRARGVKVNYVELDGMKVS